jgi:glutathione S-transferase
VLGEEFTMADCAAAPPLFYGNIVAPFDADFPHIRDYFERLLARPSFARTLEEAQPYFRFFPFHDQIPARFTTRPAPGP